jgi:hypothetical protein
MSYIQRGEKEVMQQTTNLMLKAEFLIYNSAGAEGGAASAGAGAGAESPASAA